MHYYEGITVCIEFSLKNRSISLSYVKTQLNTLLINRLQVLSNNRPAGYLLSASAFEALMDMLAEQEEKKPIKARFRPSAARLEEITRRAEQYLNDMTDDDFNDFKE